MILRELAPSVFWPRPKVTSAIVQIVLDPIKRASIDNLESYQTFVRGLFLHRRKFLRGALVGAFAELDKPTVDHAMQQLGLGAEARAEELTVDQIQQLSFALEAAQSR